MNDASASTQVLLTLGDILAWEDDVRAIGVEIDELDAKRSALIERLEFARRLFPDAVSIPPSLSATPPTPEKSRPPAKVRKGRSPSVLIPWETAILEFVSRFDRGCSYADLRAHLQESSLGDQLRQSTKSYERSMHNLAGRGAVERGYGRVFTPEAFAEFEREARDTGVPPLTQPFSRSPMGEAILRIVHTAPGLKNKQIIAELRKDTEMNASLTPNEGTAHNIIARYARRQHIVKRDDGGSYPGPNFPYDLLGLSAQREGAPSSDAGAPSAGEVAASPIENPQGFRLVG